MEDNLNYSTWNMIIMQPETKKITIRLWHHSMYVNIPIAHMYWTFLLLLRNHWSPLHFHMYWFLQLRKIFQFSAIIICLFVVAYKECTQIITYKFTCFQKRFHTILYFAVNCLVYTKFDIYIRTYIHICIHIYIHAYLHISTHIYIFCFCYSDG